MNLTESIRVALENLRANRLRAVLTMLGIIIGISAVITITTIGSSLQDTIAATMRQMGGANLLNGYVEAVMPEFETEEEWENWIAPEMGPEDQLTYEILSDYREAFADRVSHIIITEELPGGESAGSQGTSPVRIMGVTPGYMDVSKITLLAGREISDQDNRQAKAAAVVSDLYVKYAWGGENPIGQEMEVVTEDGTIYPFYIAGVYRYDAARMGGLGESKPERKIETPILVPYTYAAALNQDSTSGGGVSFFQIATTEKADPAIVAEQTQDYFNRGIYAGNEDFQVYCHDMEAELGQIEGVLGALTAAISVIAAISLLVGGVGVMNIMLVSVVERTREIGIRKALGAKNKSIRRQFLMEAVVICLLGGVIGIVCGLLMGSLLVKLASALLLQNQENLGLMMTVTLSPPVPAIVISVAFSVAIGLIFGYYPAKRAANMSPIDALRYE